MAIKDVETKCWILALFVRDDGERFLLGDGSYEFTEKQLHFAANTMANDVVEVQGNDGYLLAGQVRRPSTQTFDGYVGDSSTSKALVEERRRAFFAFFRKNFFYKVIYIFPDGSAIQRKRGFLVDAPEVKEIRQIYPEYHVALNFEDINYYYYDEDADGQEIYGKSATINLNSVVQSGGLIWLLPSEMTLTGEGTSFTLSGTVNGTALTSAELKGDTYQQTYSGKNLLNLATFVKGRIDNGVVGYASDTSSITYTDDSLTFAITANWRGVASDFIPVSPSTQYVFSSGALSGVGRYTDFYDSSKNWISRATSNPATTPASCAYVRVSLMGSSGTGTYTVSKPQFEQGTATAYEPYTGGIPAPNPDYPQQVQTATGRQVVTISSSTESQEYEVNLGKNLLDKSTATILSAFIDYSQSAMKIYNNPNCNTTYIECLPNTTYTVSKILSSRFVVATTSVEPAANVSINKYVEANAATSATITTDSAAKYLAVFYYNSSYDTSTAQQILDTLQIEKGSPASSYAAYFEPIELCKIGDYQDRIYKSGGDWYLRKETKKLVFDGSDDEQWGLATNSRFYCNANLYNGGVLPSTNADDFLAYCNCLTPMDYNTSWNSTTNYTTSVAANNTSNPRIVNKDYTTLDNFKSWLATSPVTLYYPLATATDTQITNTALIAQLNALAGATTYNGTTNFTVDGNGNLAAILSVEVEAVGGGGVEWDENGAVWEEGKPSYSIISVDSIDNVYPVLTITGRTVNPVLTDVTTGTIFQYNGTITESQVLRVDMMNKTATLNGVSVIGNVTGDWLYLAPGNNRVTYTADNADAPNATVEWQEIVG